MECLFFASHFTKPLQLHFLLIPYQTFHLISTYLVTPDPGPKLVRPDCARRERRPMPDPLSVHLPAEQVLTPRVPGAATRQGLLSGSFL